MANDRAIEYVLESLKNAGFLLSKIKFNLYEVWSSHSNGSDTNVRVRIRSESTGKGMPLGSIEKIGIADVFILVRADDPENFRAFVYPNEYIARATRISETPADYPFERNPGDKNPHDRDFWARSKWCFCLAEHLNAWHLIRKSEQSTAIDDIYQSEADGAEPEYRMRMIGAYVRDDSVRQQVLQRAAGKCEHCGVLGFRKPDGLHYVEAHHIISLAQQGPDTLDNVIALCPNHHRQAHFGEGWEQLEAEFKIKLANIRGK